MAYCTMSDVETRIGADRLAALADHDGDGSADQAVVDRAIEDAGGLIDSYLAARYEVPVSPVPERLRSCAVSLAVYFLALGRDSVTPDVRTSYRSELRWLEDAASGRASLGEGLDGAPGGGGVRHRSHERIFGRNKPL
jgi:phage gp36-like protein